LDRNPRYFGKKAFVDVLEVSPHFSEEHFRNGELDIMPFLSEGLMRTGCRVVSSGPQTVTLLAMSCGVAPLDRPSVRRAVAQALDPEALALTVQETAVVRRALNNFIPPTWPGFFPRDPISAGPESSRRALEDQGFFIDKDFPSLALYVPGGRTNADQIRFAREVERQLSRLGLSVGIRTYAALRELKDARQPFLVKIDWAMEFPDPEPILRLLFHSRSDINRANSGYASPDLDRLLDEAAAEKSPSRRNDLFRQAEAILVTALPAVPVFISEPRFAIQPYVHGARLGPLGFSYLEAKEIWLDKREGPK